MTYLCVQRIRCQRNGMITVELSTRDFDRYTLKGRAEELLIIINAFNQLNLSSIKKLKGWIKIPDIDLTELPFRWSGEPEKPKRNT